MSQVGIKEFTENEAKCMNSYTLETFFKKIQTEFFQDINISFMNYFLELINKQDEFCVHSDKLYEYEVIIKKENKLNNNDINDTLTKANDFVEGEDYLVREVPEQSDTSRGIKYKNVYMMKPKTFKLCMS